MVELLIALAITAALLSAVMVALRASFMAYQATTEVASTHTISRLVMNRMLTMIRTGREFGPSDGPFEHVTSSEFMQFRTADGSVMTLEWKQNPDAANGYPRGESLYIIMDDGVSTPVPYLLLEGVKAQLDPDTNELIKPFTLHFDKGSKLYRATIDLTIVPDDNMSMDLDGHNIDVIRLVASAMPRVETY